MTRRRSPRERWAGASRPQWFRQPRRSSSRESCSSSASCASRLVRIGWVSFPRTAAAAPGRGSRADSIGPVGNALRMTASPFRCVWMAHDDIGAGALILRPRACRAEAGLRIADVDLGVVAFHSLPFGRLGKVRGLQCAAGTGRCSASAAGNSGRCSSGKATSRCRPRSVDRSNRAKKSTSKPFGMDKRACLNFEPSELGKGRPARAASRSTGRSASPSARDRRCREPAQR